MTQLEASADEDAAAEATGEPAGGTRRGRLKVYLGAAPGSGKTFTMLREGRERRSHGEDIVAGFIETHGRPRTQEAIGTLEVIPRVRVSYKSTVIEEMDLDAVLARAPQVALVDELAHTNAPGVRHTKRWEDVEELRDAGIDVITTLNVQHLESVKDLVEHITGVSIRETVPDRVVDGADEIQFVDMSPEALRKRMKHGNIYGKEKVDSALSNFFRQGNLAALREIALRLVAQRMSSEQAGSVIAPPQDVVVAVSGRQSSLLLIRRAARIARRLGGMCTVVFVGTDDPDAEWHRLAAQLECAVRVVPEQDVSKAVVSAVRDLGAYHVILGEPLNPGVLGGIRRTIVDRVMDDLPDVNLYVAARGAVRRSEPDPLQRPSPDDLLAALTTSRQRRGSLRVYLGYAGGCGTTTALLDEARRRSSRGTDVVIAMLSSRCPPAPEGVPMLRPMRGGGPPEQLDLAGLLARNPDVVAIDDLAGTTTDGRKITEVLPAIIDSGITVIATLRLTDLRSTVDTMGQLLDRPPDRPVIDDTVLDAADELELIDVTPADLRARVRDGDVVPPFQAGPALQREYRADVLAMLREAAFRRIAEHTDRRLVDYMRTRHIETPWEARPRVLACVPARAGMEDLIRRAAALAGRRGEPFTAVTVRRPRRTDADRRQIGEYAALTHQLGGEFITLDGSDPPKVLAEFARSSLATEVVAARGPRRSHRTLRRLIRFLDQVDVIILARPAGVPAQDPRWRRLLRR